ncbi:MAG: CoA transferase [Alphaproteobacteria bacterium]|nr:CoA transferase [Alphaproteobacteria bacterium]
MTVQPLQGIKVLDLTQIFQGPYASFLMAMAGAEVVKVEAHSGDRIRRGGGPDTPLAFAMLNSNKKCLTLDLKHPRGKEILKSMAKEADVMLENFATGTMDRLGLGWEVMREINPRLIYGTATGYGVSGPDKDQLAMDHTIQAAAGIMSITGETGGPPARAGGTPSDIMGGIHFYAGVLSAILGRNATGKGTLVEVAMTEAMYFTLASEYSHYHRTGELPERRGDKTAANSAPYGRYECKDGWIALICVSEAQWERLLDLVGREDLKGDPGYASPALRHNHEPAINAMIEGWTRTRSRDEVYRQIRDNKIPVAPVRDVADVMNDPHMHERGMLNRMEHPYIGDLILPSSPIRLSEFPPSPLEFFHEPGADNAEVLGDWLGMSEADVASLAAEKVI